MPEWAERKHAATVAAREAARDLVENWPNGNPAAAALVAQEVAADHGVDAADIACAFRRWGLAGIRRRGRRRDHDARARRRADGGGFVALHRARVAARRRLPEPVMRPDRADERGTITLWVLGLCISLMFLGGLSLDLWRAVADRRELSSMADTAATAARQRRRRRRVARGTRCGSIPVRARAIALASLGADPHARGSRRGRRRGRRQSRDRVAARSRALLAARHLLGRQALRHRGARGGPTGGAAVGRRGRLTPVSGTLGSEIGASSHVQGASMPDAVIVAAARTPIGTARKGTLLDVSAFDLAKYAVARDAEALRHPVDRRRRPRPGRVAAGRRRHRPLRRGRPRPHRDPRRRAQPALRVGHGVGAGRGRQHHGRHGHRRDRGRCGVAVDVAARR